MKSFNFDDYDQFINWLQNNKSIRLTDVMEIRIESLPCMTFTSPLHVIKNYKK